MGVVILSNREDTRAAALAASILEEAIGGDFPGPHPAAEARRRVDSAGFTPEQRAAIAGSYVDVGAGEWMSLAIEDGVLRGETLGDPIALYHEGGGVFRDADDYRATVPAELRIEMRMMRRRHLPAPPRRSGHGAAPARNAVVYT